MKQILKLAAVLAVSLAPMATIAKPHPNGNGNGNGHGNGHGQFEIFNESGQHGCPPGLAWRSPACVPPGLARQGVTTEDWIGPITTHYHEGDILRLEDLVWVTDYDRYGLPLLPDGQQYAVIDGTLVRIDSENYQILQLIRAIAAVVN